MEGNLLKRQRGLGHSSSKLKSLKFKPKYCRLSPTGLEYYEKRKDRKVPFYQSYILFGWCAMHALSSRKEYSLICSIAAKRDVSNGSCQDCGDCSLIFVWSYLLLPGQSV